MFNDAAREEWTHSPEAVIDHLKTLSVEHRKYLLTSYDKMAHGGQGGQIEGWSLWTVRSTVYPNWSNEDFQRVLDEFHDFLTLSKDD
jgi:hypothetical protein